MDFSKLNKNKNLIEKTNRLKKKLENTIIESEHNGLILVFNGLGELEKVEFEEKGVVYGEEDIGCAIMIAYKKASKKIKEISYQETNKIYNSLNI